MSCPEAKVRLLRDAVDAVEERGRSYGDADIHFARTIGAINSIFRHKLAEELTPSDWAMMMMIDKIAREQQVPKRDNALDIAGYSACLAQCRTEAGNYGGAATGR